MLHASEVQNICVHEVWGERWLPFLCSAHQEVSCCVLRMSGRLETKYQPRILSCTINFSLNDLIILKRANHTAVSNDRGRFLKSSSIISLPYNSKYGSHFLKARESPLNKFPLSCFSVNCILGGLLCMPVYMEVSYLGTPLPLPAPPPCACGVAGEDMIASADSVGFLKEQSCSGQSLFFPA